MENILFSWPKQGRGPTDINMGLGPQTPTKKLTYLVDILGQLLSWNNVLTSDPFPLKRVFDNCNSKSVKSENNKNL